MHTSYQKKSHVVSPYHSLTTPPNTAVSRGADDRWASPIHIDYVDTALVAVDNWRDGITFWDGHAVLLIACMFIEAIGLSTMKIIIFC